MKDSTKPICPEGNHTLGSEPSSCHSCAYEASSPDMSVEQALTDQCPQLGARSYDALNGASKGTDDR